jgi:hypothetical protein
MRGLSIALRKAPLALTDSEPPQSLDIFWCVVTPAASSPTGQRKRSQPLPESEPARAYAECIGGLTDCADALLFEHTHTVKLTDRFL